MTSKRKFSIDWPQIILGIALVILGVFLFKNPFGTWLALGVLVGIIAVIRGISAIATGWRDRNNEVLRPFAIVNIIFGIFVLILGIYLFINKELALASVGTILGIWIVFEGFQNIAWSGWIRLVMGPIWVIQVIISIMMIIGGFRLMWSPAGGLTAAFLLGIVIVINGIYHIISGLIGHPKSPDKKDYPQGPWTKNTKDVGGDD